MRNTAYLAFPYFGYTSGEILIYFSHMDYILNDVCNENSYTSLLVHVYNSPDQYNDSDYRKLFHTTDMPIIEGLVVYIDR